MKKRLIVSLAVFCFVILSHDALGQGAAPAIALHFSAQPDEAEIFRARVFDEPLVPMGGHPDAGEDAALANALAKYSSRTNIDDFSSLAFFLKSFPDSAWSPSLLLHFGTEYYNTGHYSKALESWEQAWQQCKGMTEGPGNAQADRALGELARMYSKLGRMNELQELLNSTSNRSLSGPGIQLIHAARQALWMMQNRPDVSFRCGPLALKSILARNDSAKALDPLIFYSKSTTNGFSLSQVGDLSRQLGLNYQTAFRSPGAAFIVPAVVHWKTGHYAALLQKDGDRFLVQDLTFRSTLRVSAAALDEEASGYSVVPPGPLPAGWRLVPEHEADGVWGKGSISGQNGNSTGPNDPTGGGPPSSPRCRGGNGGGSGAGAGGGCGGMGGMTTYTMHLMLVSLTLNDMPVGYSPPLGPAVYFIATYNQLEANQPATFYYSNLGPLWDFNWLSYVTDNPSSPGADLSLYQSGGGTIDYTGFNPATQSYAFEPISQTTLTQTSSSSYEQQFQDGSKREFALSDGSLGTSRRIFMTQLIDPAGNAVELQYDTSLRITSIIDALGQTTSFLYTNSAFPYAITAVIDPFGRGAYLEYNTSGMLSQITDVLGITSQYVYGTNDFVNALITPYGKTTFAAGLTNGWPWLQATDPLGQSEFLECPQFFGPPPIDPPALVPQGMGEYNYALSVRNSYYWDKKAFADGAGDYTKAVIYHFLHDPDINTESRVLESIKKPLENRVWFNYPGQSTALFSGANDTSLGAGVIGSNSQPSAVGRVLDDGTSQVYYYGYNSAGNITNFIDPVGRTYSYIYANNNVDLLKTFMTRNGKSELLGLATYSAQHRPLTIIDASGQTTTNTYNAQGQVTSTTDPKGEKTSYSYDTNGYLLTVTGPLQSTNDVMSFTYDGFGRVRTVTDTEGYTLTFDYDEFNRKTRITHPDGTYEQFVYNLLDLAAFQDRLGRWTTNVYNANRQLVQTTDPLGRTTTYDWCSCGSLEGIIDAMGRTTAWSYDVQSRPVAKKYPDGSMTAYVYENTTSRLASKFDEQGQQKVYQYYADNNLMQVSYPNALIATPTVVYTYDPDYSRVLTMQDGVGSTIYTYNPITSTPVVGAGRLVSVSGPFSNSTITYQYDQLGRVVNRAINGVAQATTYDVLGRPIIVTNALGSFSYGYVEATSRLGSETYPNGQTNLYSYYNNLGDQRLLRIQHLYPNGSLLSAFGYAYNADGLITAWTNQWDTLPTRVWLPAYDAADQLTNVACLGGPPVVTNYAYAYDPVGNRTLVQSNAVPNRFNYNALNQLVGATPGYTNSATYEWDAEKRLTAVNQGVNRSEFTYDGLGRRIEIVEKMNGAVMSNNYYQWCGNQICEIRDTTGTTVRKRLFDRGEAWIGGIDTTNYFYSRDHLGSVRDACDQNGMLSTRYDYDPYGQQTVIQENAKTTFGFTGYLFHAPSGLYLTLHRALNSTTGRWLSRDPLGETHGINVYAYVLGNPVNYVDPLGLCGDYYDNFDPVTGTTWNPVDTPSEDPSEDPAEAPEPQWKEPAKEFGNEIAGGMEDAYVEGLLDATGEIVSKSIGAFGYLQILLTPEHSLSAEGDMIGSPENANLSGNGNLTSYPNPRPNGSVNSPGGGGSGEGGLTGSYNNTSGQPATSGSAGSCQQTQ